MQTVTSETESKSLDLSICVHHYTLRAPCPKGQGILLGRKKSTKESIYGELGRDKIQFYLPSQNLITQECASYRPTMPHHSSSSAPAKTTSTFTSMASTLVSATTQRRITCAWSSPLTLSNSHCSVVLAIMATREDTSKFLLSATG